MTIESFDEQKPNRAARCAATQDAPRIRPKFISIQQACAYLNCGKSYFYEEIYPVVLKRALGRRTLIDFDSLDEIADSLPVIG